jgi:hypothetical protein
MLGPWIKGAVRCWDTKSHFRCVSTVPEITNL